MLYEGSWSKKLCVFHTELHSKRHSKRHSLGTYPPPITEPHSKNHSKGAKIPQFHSKYYKFKMCIGLSSEDTCRFGHEFKRKLYRETDFSLTGSLCEKSVWLVFSAWPSRAHSCLGSNSRILLFLRVTLLPDHLRTHPYPTPVFDGEDNCYLK